MTEPRPPAANGDLLGNGTLRELLPPVVDSLCEHNSGPNSLLTRNPLGQEHPSWSAVVEIVESLRAVLFPGYFGIAEMNAASMRFHIGATLDRCVRSLREQVRRGLCFAANDVDPARCERCDQRAWEITHHFVERLPEVRRLLGTDVQAAYEGDPAATSRDETLFCYPGVLAITSQRLAHELYKLDVPLLPRMITEHAHSATGIDIHPGARIAESFFIDHGTGVVIGETSVIGRHVRIYQGVTLGAKSFPLDPDGRPIKGVDRHPIVEDDVIIYSGATILGRVTIGRGSVIGGNVWLTHSVAPGSRLRQVEARSGVFQDGAGI
jgi:serine O-acetyltransferase